MGGGDPLHRQALYRLLSGYAPIPGVPDELVDAQGRLRPAWDGFIANLDGLSGEEVRARFARGNQYLRDAGVYYRHYGKGDVAGRDWPLSHIPVLIAQEEWAEITAALAQRAELLERIVADFYGENRLIAEGHLPASLVLENPHWLRPLVGVKPRSGHFLHFIAFDLGRGPDGRWWVLGDKTEAPSGAGFALENRVATARTHADFYPRANVHRLAGFFGAFRAMLERLGQNAVSKAAILTPGHYNDTYYEQAYIARYLNLMLLEGEDLTVENGRLMVRTIEGPRPIGVLWRRLTSDWCDPLELREESRLGTPGMVEAVRAGSLTLVNALGTGILETQALLAFLPQLSRAVLGEDLAIPNIATWWCGQEREFNYVRDHAERMLIGPAMSNRLAIELKGGWALAKELHGDSKEHFDSWFSRQAANLVGQEMAQLSTAPVWEGDRLVPRPLNLRAFLARTENGWEAMPGGFARVGTSDDPSAVSMRDGSAVADVWIVSTAPVPDVTLLPTGKGPFVRTPLTTLPARAADNLYWLGRYVDRAEALARLLRAYHGRLAEGLDAQSPLLVLVRKLMEEFQADADEPLPDGLLAAIASAINSANHVRDRFSVDGWAALADLESTARRIAPKVQAGNDAARACSMLIRKLTGFSGLVHENMYRLTGWRFLTIGRSIERAINMADLLAALAHEDAPDGALDLAIEVGDSVMSHRRRYTVATNRDTIVDLLALDSLNPRSILYQLDEIRSHGTHLPHFSAHGQLSELARAIFKTQTMLTTARPDELTAEALMQLSLELQSLSDLLSDAYLR